MRRILFKTCLLSAALFISVVTFSQQGVNSGKQQGQNKVGQGVQNPADSSGIQTGQAKQNDDYRPELQPGESYPVDQNLEINKENLINPLNNQPAGMGAQDNQNQVTPGVQNQVTPGVQNQGNPDQTLPSGLGNQSVPGNTNKGETNQINPGINNNPGVPNDQGTQNPANIQKDKPKSSRNSNASKASQTGQGSQSVQGDTATGISKQINPGINNNNPGVPNDQGTQNPANIHKDKENQSQSGQKP